MIPDLPTLNSCPRCHASDAIYKCVVQDGVMTFMLRPTCADCGFTTEDVFVTETRAATAWNAIVPEPREVVAAPTSSAAVETARVPRMRDDREFVEAGMTPARLAEIEAAGDAAYIPELVAEIRRLRRDRPQQEEAGDPG